MARIQQLDLLNPAQLLLEFLHAQARPDYVGPLAHVLQQRHPQHAGEGMHPDLVVGPMVHRPPAQPVTALQAPAWLREAYRRTRKDGAAGVDGVTAAHYETALEANLTSLLERFKSGQYRAPAVRRVHIPKPGKAGKTRPILHGASRPALLITNDFDATLASLLRRYARRWLIEKFISAQLSFFHLDRLSSSMVIKVDFDLVMTVLAYNLYRLLAFELPPGFRHCTPQRCSSRCSNPPPISSSTPNSAGCR